MIREFRRRFWQPPRAHGEVDEERSVGFIELFYDLVYVVVIARLAHHFAAHLDWRGVYEFAVIFGLIWLAWLNGTIYQDLHGREDGRSRTYIFVQMGILAVIGVYTAEAAGEDGQGFALAYTTFLVLLTWMWWTVRREDTEEYEALTSRYLIGMAISVVVTFVSAFVSDDLRLVLWAVIVIGSLGMILAMESRSEELGFHATDSGVERFGLFTIIVLGEVVVGVVTGMSETARNLPAIATGLIGLCIGFGIWWTYFDFVGRRFARNGSIMRWTVSHLPVVGAIAAGGAAMVTLVEHAEEATAPAGAAWVLSGSIAVALFGLTYLITTLRDYTRLASVYRPITAAMLSGGLVSLAIGWWAPRPWLLVLALYGVLSAIWWVGVHGWLSLENPSDVQPNAEADIG